MVLVILGTVAVVGVFIVVGLWIDRRISILPRVEDLQAAGHPKPLGGEHEVGLAPSSALLSDPEKMKRVVEHQRCCKAAMAQEAEDEVRYDAKLLRVIRLRCAICGGARSLYFQPRATA